MVDFPSSLPLPQVAEYSVGNIFGHTAVTFEHGNTRQRRRSKRDRWVFSLTFVFTKPQFWQWQAWANIAGYNWHVMNLESAYSGLTVANAINAPHTIRYISDISYDLVGSDNIRAMVVAEMDVSTVPTGVVVNTGNWYVGGTPASPSNSNKIIAGTPASPSSTNTIIAGAPDTPAA